MDRLDKFLDTVLVIACFMVAFISLISGFNNFSENNVLSFTLDAFLFSTWIVLGVIKLHKLIDGIE